MEWHVRHRWSYVGILPLALGAEKDKKYINMGVY